ncbi:MAG TPA: extracellular solute-binding protein [Chloroflexota bacterium]|nr:extracellular solute-binding protein [Chloroflexota bacterium]
MARGLLLLAFVTGLACAPGASSGASGAARPSAPERPTGAAPAAPAAGASAAPAAAPASAPAEWDQVLAAARQEGTVVVDGPGGDIIRRKMVDGFTSAYPGITIEWSGGTAPELAAKLEAERRAGIYALDVMIAGTNVMLTQVKNPGFLEPIKPALLLPEVADPANWQDGRLDMADAEGEYDLVFIQNPMIAAAHNPRMVRPEEIDELPKLLDPKWKGKIVISDPLAGGQGQAAFRWLWAVMGPEKATEYIRALRAQAGQVDRDRRRMLEWIARGRYPILFNPDPTTLQQLAQEGVNIPVLPGFKDYGTYVTPGFGSVGLIKDAPHPNAAKVFLNWLLSKDGQTAYSTALNAGSRRLDVPRDHLPPELHIQPDLKYWASYKEAEAIPPPELVTLLKEVFGR